MSKKESKWNEIVIGAIEVLHSKNEDNEVTPNYVSIQDITKLINQGIGVTIRNLIESGEIQEANAVGGKYYKIITDEEEDNTKRS